MKMILKSLFSIPIFKIIDFKNKILFQRKIFFKNIVFKINSLKNTFLLKIENYFMFFKSIVSNWVQIIF